MKRRDSYITQEGYDKLKKEWEYLKTKRRSELSKAIEIARGHGDKVPYLLIVGPKEAEADQVSVRMRTNEGDKKTVIKVDKFINIVEQKVGDKDLDWEF